MSEWIKKLKAYQYPTILLLVGLLLMLLPFGENKEEKTGIPGTELEEILSSADGVGRVRVLLSEKGVVVVCDGAEKANIRLDILRALGSYTGFGSDRITVLKMSD